MGYSRFARNFRLGIKSLLAHKLRSLLTILGVVFGVGSVVAMLSVGEGASRKVLEQIRKLGSQNIILSSVKPTDEENNSRQDRSRTLAYGLLYDDLARLETYPAVGKIAPVKIKRDEARLGAKATNVRLVGTTPEWFELVPRDLVAGRRISQRDLDEQRPVCVLAEGAARKLLASDHTLGQLISVGSESYTVVGVIRTESAGSSIQLPDRGDDVYIPLNVMRVRIGDTTTQRSAGSRVRETVELHQVIAQVRETGRSPEVRASFLGNLLRRIGLGGQEAAKVAAIDNVEPTAEAVRAGLDRFHPRDDFDVSVPLALLNQERETQRIFKTVLGSIAGISLLVGGIGIMNIMLASVTERTREIGLRRAIGAKRKHIVSQFLVETTALSLTGGLLGVGVGVGIPMAIEYYSNVPVVVTAWSIALALSISAAVGILFGLYPAVRASLLDPVTALRHE